MGISGVDGTVEDVHVGSGGGSGGAVAVQQQQQVHHHYPPVSASAGTGISGAGRGRYGRQNGRSDHHGVRRPLGSSSMNSVNGYTSRLTRNDVKGAAGESSKLHLRHFLNPNALH